MSRILFADHNGFTQRMGIQFLSAEGHDVASASGGEDALRYIQEQRPDIAILDTQMPGPSGLEICWRIKSDSNLRDTKVVLLNRVLDPIPESEAEKAGSDAMLVKPLDGPMLVGAVNSLIEKMRSEIAAESARPEAPHPNGFRRDEGEPCPAAERTAELAEAANDEATNGINGLVALGRAVSDTSGPREAQAGPDAAFRLSDPPAAATPPKIQGIEPNGLVPAALPGRPVVRTIPVEQTHMMTETEVSATHDQDQDLSPAIDFAAIVDEALGNNAEERELQKRIEQAIHQILRPAVASVAESVTREVYVAHRAQRRVEEAVNGLLLPAIVSIADGSSQGVLAAFRSK